MRNLTSFLKHERGVALIEFAIMFPFLFLLIFGGIEISRLILIQQKLEKSGYIIADIVTQYSPATKALASNEISEAQMNTNVFPIFARVMSPYGKPSDQRLIVTSVTKQGGQPRIMWQMAGGGTLSGCDSSTPQVCVRSIVNDAGPVTPPNAAVAGQTANFPPEISGLLSTMPNGENMIVTEAFFFYHPILQDLLMGVGQVSDGAAGFNFYIQPRYYVKRTFFYPRNGNMHYLPPTFPEPNN